MDLGCAMIQLSRCVCMCPETDTRAYMACEAYMSHIQREARSQILGGSCLPTSQSNAFCLMLCCYVFSFSECSCLTDSEACFCTVGEPCLCDLLS